MILKELQELQSVPKATDFCSMIFKSHYEWIKELLITAHVSYIFHYFTCNSFI